jgi:hypothetical protein
MVLSDATITISVRYAIIHLILWQALHLFDLQASLKHVSQSKIFTVEEHKKVLTEVYHSVISITDNTNDIRQLKKQIHDSIFEYHNFILMHLGEYQKSISLTDLYLMMDEEPVKKIIDPPLNELAGTQGIEKQIRQRSHDLFNLILAKDQLQHNPLHLFHKLSMLNKDQLTQLLVAIGNRTDINDDVISYTIQSSLLKGLQNPLEMAIDSLAGKKPVMYNKGSIKKSQYFGRKQHLVVSDLKYLYQQDCGTSKIIQFLVTSKNKEHILGKNIVENNNIVTITRHNVEQYIGQTVNFRSPLACKHNDGICKICAGELISNQTIDLHVGMNSSTQMVQEITQKILSAKHLTKTASIVYSIPKDVEHCFKSEKNLVYMTNTFMNYLKNGYLGIDRSDIGILSDLKLLQKDKSFIYEKYSKIRHIYFKIPVPDNEYQVFEFSMTDDKGHTPYFHKEFLYYIKSKYNELITDNEMIWIPFKNTKNIPAWDVHLPMFGSVIVNDNMLAFVKRIVSFLAKDIIQYKSATAVLKDFSNLVYRKSSVNIAHIEVVLRAYMINSNIDYSIPIDPDLEDCNFRSTSSLLKKRSISGEISFESIYKFFTNPSTYVVPSNKSIFDVYYNI